MYNNLNQVNNANGVSIQLVIAQTLSSVHSMQLPSSVHLYFVRKNCTPFSCFDSLEEIIVKYLGN